MYVLYKQTEAINNKRLNKNTDIIPGNVQGVGASRDSCSG